MIGYSHMKNMRIVFALFLCAFGNFLQTHAMQKKLVSAAFFGDSNKVKKLLKKGADVNGLTNWAKRERSALHVATFFNKKEMIEFLLATEGINVDIKDGNGSTPLIVASQ